ncbi:hypothetical protein OBBRIDRAFT_826525 [Obba rivulosa]|uniref:Protein kinase domain-containing protein n=1 Tax=Obba rivulosa TaxID=1052685 RepID=A0A8E2ARZ8_9APHY|nr:hypothetical protein OBBRIDRAFT_826525 [Obba rivulosa]
MTTLSISCDERDSITEPVSATQGPYIIERTTYYQGEELVKGQLSFSNVSDYGEREENAGRVIHFTALLHGDSGDLIPVHCKMESGRYGVRRLRNEAIAYKFLAELQGKGVPVCYGHFEGRVVNEIFGCVVTRISGEPVTDSESIYDGPEEFRHKLLELVYAIHKRHVVHGDLVPSNILINEEGDPVIVDFDCSRSNHNCSFSRQCSEIDGMTVDLGLQTFVCPEHILHG